MNRKEKSFLENVLHTRLATTNDRPKIPAYSFRGQEQRIPSIDTGVGNASLPEQKVYTGTKMMGIATMHKSNSVPIFSQEEAIDISHMRR